MAQQKPRCHNESHCTCLSSFDMFGVSVYTAVCTRQVSMQLISTGSQSMASSHSALVSCRKRSLDDSALTLAIFGPYVILAP